MTNKYQHTTQLKPLDYAAFQHALPQRNLQAHKGNFGSVGIVGGDAGMVGALLLAARAALLSGAGRVYAAALSQDAPSVDMLHPEIMMRSRETLQQNVANLSCVAIGMGLGQSAIALQQLEFWLTQDLPLLLDADALNLIAQHPHLVPLLQKRAAPSVITPHPGEAARLLKISVDSIQQHRLEKALILASNFHVTCVLKGAGTICAHHDGAAFINTTGNAGLASGGTGDVLSGIIASLIGQGLSSLEAAKLGVYLHGAAADALVQRGVGPVGLSASEVALEVRRLINTFI